jgi:hypothetical protein
MSDQKITIDGNEYELDSLNEGAKAQIMSMRATDAEIGRLQTLIAICQTARNAYAASLQKELPVSPDA